jgi:hypothetical protein
LGSSHVPSGDGIQHDVPQHAQETWSAFDNLSLVPPLKDVPDPAMSPVEPSAVRAVDLMHQPPERVGRRPQQQVHVIPHQAVSIDVHGKAPRRSLEQREIPSEVDIINEHLALVIAARHDVMEHSRCVNSKRTGHASPTAIREPSSDSRVFRDNQQNRTTTWQETQMPVGASVCSFRKAAFEDACRDESRFDPRVVSRRLP